ncbi:MAG TPA: M18 family aminopeptidase [Porticoccaceae bacterium]|nr:M18 family aminopeptidase [Porticoccaceae bacterium]
MTVSSDYHAFNTELLDFIRCSPTPFHATHRLAAALRAENFIELREQDAWSLQLGGKYFLTRNDSSIIAFIYGGPESLNQGIRMVGAHTDSPNLRVKPLPEKVKDYFQLGVEVYGGVLLNPWFDRDLSIAGRVVYREKGSGKLTKGLIDFKAPVAIIPSLAIHLDREANTGRTVNPQTDIPPILFEVKHNAQPGNKVDDFREIVAAQLKTEHAQLGDVEVLDYELSLYDTQAPAQIGLHGDFLAAARLDNLLSCFCGLKALLSAGLTSGSGAAPATCMLICTDHEEVGSASACGAQGPMLQHTLERIFPDASERLRGISQSLLISADNAHGVHPNYAGRHDDNHVPLLNHGPVLKINANQRYATSGVTAALFRQWCEAESVNLQSFVTRTDLGCGSTIGPITATQIGVPTLDVGVPTFAMHSVRELAGSRDALDLCRVMSACFRHVGPLSVA